MDGDLGVVKKTGKCGLYEHEHRHTSTHPNMFICSVSDGRIFFLRGDREHGKCRFFGNTHAHM